GSSPVRGATGYKQKGHFLRSGLFAFWRSLRPSTLMRSVQRLPSPSRCEARDTAGNEGSCIRRRTRYLKNMKNTAELQQRLNAFYATALSEARPCFSEQDLEALSAPFLIKISDEYLNAPLRIMFVGKETNNWKGQLNTFYDLHNPVEVMIERYEKQFSRSEEHTS